MWRRSPLLMGSLTHVVLMVVRSPGHGGARGVRGDDGLAVTLQAGGEIPQHGGVSHWGELMMTWHTSNTGRNTKEKIITGWRIQVHQVQQKLSAWILLIRIRTRISFVGQVCSAKEGI